MANSFPDQPKQQPDDKQRVIERVRRKIEEEAARRRAEAREPGGGTVYVHRGLPGFIRAQLRTASRGGSSGYEDAGCKLGETLGSDSLCPINAELHEWAEELDRLDTFIQDDELLAKWLRRTFPRVMDRVPKSRMPQFMAGLRRAHKEGLIGTE